MDDKNLLKREKQNYKAVKEKDWVPLNKQNC